MNSKPYRFLLSGYYGFGNVGDEALLEVIVEQLKRRYPLAGIEVLSATPEQTAQTFGVEACARMDIRAVKTAIHKADLVLSGGGGLLQNATSLKSLFYYTGILSTAARMKRRSMIFAQSIGPLDLIGRRVVGRLCRRVTAATVRDTRSTALLQTILPNVPIERTADPVFLYNPTREPDAALVRGIDAASGLYAVVSVRRSAQSERVAKTVAQVVDRLAATWGIQSVFVPLGGPPDAEIATNIIRRCRSKPMLLPEADLATVAALIAQSRVVIGMRLHALILAARFAVPFLALAYDPKIQALLEDLDYPLRPLWSLEAQSAGQDPITLTDSLVEQHASTAEHLALAAQRMTQAAERNFTVLDKVLEGAAP